MILGSRVTPSFQSLLALEDIRPFRFLLLKARSNDLFVWEFTNNTGSSVSFLALRSFRTRSFLYFLTLSINCFLKTTCDSRIRHIIAPSFRPHHVLFPSRPLRPGRNTTCQSTSTRLSVGSRPLSYSFQDPYDSSNPWKTHPWVCPERPTLNKAESPRVVVAHTGLRTWVCHRRADPPRPRGAYDADKDGHGGSTASTSSVLQYAKPICASSYASIGYFRPGCFTSQVRHHGRKDDC